MYDSMMSPSEPHKNMKEVELDWFSKVVPDIFHSPEYYINIVKFRDIFNWTMTYRKDSDIPMLYGQVLHKRDVSDNAKLLLEQENNKKSYDAIYSRKKRDAVWLVSHCSTKSKREKYIEKLKNHINVDILGHCGENLCPKTSRHSGCIEDIVKTYKFVLSFENTFHTDYVTEKLFDWFPRDIIPVVYGMADYNKIVPDGTIINAANFSSPKLLANYLNYVGSNRDVYVKYLRRKRRYVTVGHDVMQQKAYCMLCDWLHNLNTHRKSYSKIDQWWQLNDTSGYITLYKQAMSSSGYSQRMFWVVFLVILLLILFFCQCVTFAYKRLAIRQTVKMTFKLNKW
ncbi:alpha-(1,3)-fucosyltransferase C-like [Mercenaria mercenaria]|uniref:alpha-(1,3)-fucosyltransferase C-like n=1 Tax=Mercenaria mercenaria TaxID=6596 RepID=UPI00234EF150|nr:alpha-(1,3)-fucosyltransferase C-like [Mercenaria mercenaria]